MEIQACNRWWQNWIQIPYRESSFFHFYSPNEEESDWFKTIIWAVFIIFFFTCIPMESSCLSVCCAFWSWKNVCYVKCFLQFFSSWQIPMRRVECSGDPPHDSPEQDYQKLLVVSVSRRRCHVAQSEQCLKYCLSRKPQSKLAAMSGVWYWE